MSLRTQRLVRLQDPPPSVCHPSTRHHLRVSVFPFLAEISSTQRSRNPLKSVMFADWIPLFRAEIPLSQPLLVNPHQIAAMGHLMRNPSHLRFWNHPQLIKQLFHVFLFLAQHRWILLTPSIAAKCSVIFWDKILSRWMSWPSADSWGLCATP
jgi:hypothetical protein